MVFSCEEFVDWMLREATRARVTDAPCSPEKPEPTSRDVDELLPIFNKPKPKR